MQNANDVSVRPSGGSGSVRAVPSNISHAKVLRLLFASAMAMGTGGRYHHPQLSYH